MRRRPAVLPDVLSRSMTSSIARRIAPRESPVTLAVLGGGLAGLSSAVQFVRRLDPRVKERVKVVVFEKQERIGGWCHAVRLENGRRVADGQSLVGTKEPTVVFETGPRSVRPVGLQGWISIELAHFLGLTPHLLRVPKTAPSAKNRYIYTPPSLTLLPSSIWSVVRNLFEKDSLMRKVLPQLLLEPFRPRSKLHTSGHGDESVDAFFARRFGRPLAEEMISAMIHGIYAGDSRKLSVRAVFPQLWEAEREFGSVILAGLFGGIARRRGWKEKSRWRLNAEKEEREVDEIKRAIRASGPDGERLVSEMERASVWGVQGGLQEIAIRMKAWLEQEGIVEFRTGASLGTVEEVEQSRDGEWRIRTPEGTVSASHLITTLPNLLPSSFAVPKFPSTTVSVINLSFPLPSSSSGPLYFPRGFGYLIPRTVPRADNPHGVLGVLFDSDVMPEVDTSREQGLYKCSLILGGSYWLDKDRDASSMSHEELVDAALETLRMHFPRQSFPQPIDAYTHTHRDCIPQVPVNSRIEILAFSKRLTNANDDRRGGGAKVGVVGGGFAAVGVNGAIKAASEVGTAFAQNVNERLLAGDPSDEMLKKRVRDGVKTGMEMWQV
ncbi:hypothetical protein JCM3766R1_001222 [Sporobolomyces carnicolor]